MNIIDSKNIALIIKIKYSNYKVVFATYLILLLLV